MRKMNGKRLAECSAACWELASERRAKHPPSVLSAPGQCAPIPSHTHGHFMPPRNTRTAERNTQGRENYLSRERQLLLDERSGLRPPEWSHAEAKGKNCYDRTKLVKGRRTYQSRESGQRNEQDILSLPLSPPLSHPAAAARAAVRAAATAASAPATSPAADAPPSFPGTEALAAALVQKPAPIPSPPLATDPWLQRTPSCSCWDPQRPRPGKQGGAGMSVGYSLIRREGKRRGGALWTSAGGLCSPESDVCRARVQADRH